VLVVGGFARSVGLYAVACAQALGAARVVYADADASRLERAATLGAETVEVAAGEDGWPDWPSKLGRFPITVDASGDHRGLHAALRSTAPDGTCTSVAIYFEPTTPLPLLEMYTRGCTLHTSRVHARAVIPQVLELVAAGRLDPAVVTSAVADFADAPAALADPPTKLVLVSGP
jgi:threonine dehydrogenase-like Zn-dependent dehydrogenase